MKAMTIRWVLAHDPIELFIRAGHKFAEDVKDMSNGKIQIEVMTVSDYSRKYNNGKEVSRHSLLDLMEQGKIEMSQTYTTSLTPFHNDMAVLDLPFLFRDHDHATRVLDGSVGTELFDGLAKKSKIRGLVFTYSGGHRMIAGTKPITKVADLKGLRIRTANSAVAEATFRAVGAEPVPMDLEQMNQALEKEEVQGGESTYPRFFSMGQDKVSQYINDTQHSLFLTSILINQDFWNGLDEDVRKILLAAAQKAALAERKESVDDIAQIQEQCRNEGISIVTLPEAEKEVFKRATEKVYSAFEKSFSPGLVERIKLQH